MVADVAEEGHADDGVDEGDKGEEGADVEQRRQRHDQREQQLTDTLRGLHDYDYDERRGEMAQKNLTVTDHVSPLEGALFIREVLRDLQICFFCQG